MLDLKWFQVFYLHPCGNLFWLSCMRSYHWLWLHLQSITTSFGPIPAVFLWVPQVSCDSHLHAVLQSNTHTAPFDCRF